MIMVCSTSFEFCSVLLTTKAILFFSFFHLFLYVLIWIELIMITSYIKIIEMGLPDCVLCLCGHISVYSGIELPVLCLIQPIE